MEHPEQAAEDRPDHQTGPPAHDFPSVFFWLGVAFTIYLLAIGPAVKLHRAAPQTRPVIEAMYFWVDPLARSSPTANAVLQWYVRKVWREK